MKKNIILLSSFLLLIACSANPQIEIPSEGNGYLAGVLKTGENESVYYLTDYFPALTGIDSMTASAGIQASALSDDWQTFRLETAGMPHAIGTLAVWKAGKQLNIVVDNAKQNDLSADIPHLFSLSHTPKSITVGFTEQPEQIIALWQNVQLKDDLVRIDEKGISIQPPANTSSFERSFIRVYASGGEQVFSDVLIPLKNGKAVTSAGQIDRHDPHAQILYSLMIDRFYNGNTDNDWKIDSPDVLPQVDYLGGDIKGITDKIRTGFFNDLGINTIWISPITQNPYDAWGLNLDPYTRFSGYHGYWPIYSTVIDQRFGTKDELDEMLAVAHENGLNVILDYVANHLHINSPVLQQHPDWTTPPDLPDGRKNIGIWDDERLTTWFDEHIPTLDLERPEIYQPMTDSALHWIANFDFDGFRHDATKHIPEDYWRTLTAKMKERFPDRQLYQIGETYGSPQLIGGYVKSGMLDAQFDFNVYDRSIRNIASPEGSMKEIAKVINESLNYYGYHNLMGNITGNHDRPRFISLAGGTLAFDEDHKAAGWKRNITVGDPAGYSKLMLLEALMMTIPGVPCVYQGDEYGVPGGNDPDNRRMMRFEGYTAKEQQVLDNLKKLASLRRNSLPLIYGDLIPLSDDENTLIFTRIYMGEPVIVILNRSDKVQNRTVSLPANMDGKGLVPQFRNGTLSENENRSAELTINPLTFEIFTLNK